MAAGFRTFSLSASVGDPKQTERLIQALEENTRAQLLLARTMPDFITQMQSADAVARAGLTQNQINQEAAEVARLIKRKEA